MLDDRQELRGRNGIHEYDRIISTDNLLAAWREFLRGKRKKADVQEFQHNLMDNLLSLQRDLAAGTYRHGGYHPFKISDPKPRDIHKATVCDRLLHHAVYRVLYPLFDRRFVNDSFSCREGKGTHLAMRRFRLFAGKVSRNHTRTCWVLKCDIRKFFASIDQAILLDVVRRHIRDERTVALISEIVGSFQSTAPGTGLPLGNLTSQLLVNVYMNEFDQFAKHRLKARFYIRYADDFVILGDSRPELEVLLRRIAAFLRTRLRLEMHPNKVSITTIASGVDFLGWVHFPDHSVLRSATRRRMLKNLQNDPSEAVQESYRGLLSHGNAHTLIQAYVGGNKATRKQTNR